MHSDNQSTILRPQLLKLLSAVLLPLLAGALLTGCTIGDGEAVRRLQPAAEVAVAPAAPPSPTGADVAFQPADVTLATALVVDGLDTPLFVTHAGDGSDRLFVVEKGGTIRIVVDGELLAEPFLDISDLVTTGGNEQGLLGLAFAPDFAESGAFFVNYSDTAGDTVIARYQRQTADANRADAAGAVILLQVEQPARNHNGGMVLFGPDGYLYIGLGDGGGSGDRYGNGQNPDSLLGKMLRIDVITTPAAGYTIPADNPWLTADWQGQEVRDEIWAVGLRNPWRYSFDRLTGDLWIGDVGQNQYEEIDFTPAEQNGGLNYGWPIMEGTHCYSSNDCDPTGLVMPVAEYSHSGHCSVTGGYVYRGVDFPMLTGVYLYGDYCSGTIWGSWPSGGVWQNAELLESGVRISSFGEDEAGELYITDMSAGQLLRLVVE